VDTLYKTILALLPMNAMLKFKSFGFFRQRWSQCLNARRLWFWILLQRHKQFTVCDTVSFPVAWTETDGFLTGHTRCGNQCIGGPFPFLS